MSKKWVKESMTTWIDYEPDIDKLVRLAAQEWGSVYTQAEYMAMAEQVAQKWYRAAERVAKKQRIASGFTP